MSVAQRSLSHGEILADGVVHAVGLAGAMVGSAALIAAAALDGAAVAPVAVYAFALIAMLAASAAYSLRLRPHLQELLRRFDHAGILIMIAGTYTPFTAGILTGGRAVVLTTLVWAIAAIGVVLKTVVAPHGLRGLTTLLYAAFGWLGVLVAQPFLAVLSPQVVWLVLAGGIVYSLGIIVYALPNLPYYRAIWHGFVIVAAAIHFCAIFLMVTQGA